MSLTDVALACKKAENGFVGAQSGIMDQYIACCGVKGHALVIDTRGAPIKCKSPSPVLLMTNV